MNDKNATRTQLIAVLLIVLAAICIGVGELHGWVHLIDFGNLFGGAGVGILTGQHMTQSTMKGGGDIVNAPLDGAQ